MARMPLEPEAFCEAAAKIVQDMLPDQPIEFIGPIEILINGKHLDLSNVYRMILYDPERGEEIAKYYFEQTLEGDSAASMSLPFSAVESRIMPRIHSISIFDRLDREQVAFVPYVNDTVIMFVIDMVKKTTSITVEQLLLWGKQIEDIDLLARENLDNYESEFKMKIIESKEGGRAAVISVQDGYDASRLLLPTLHSNLASELNGDFFVAIPARDMFLAIGDGPDGFVRRIRKRIAGDFRRLPYPITKDFFLVTQDGVAGTIRRESS